jgi:hypothetical protein
MYPKAVIKCYKKVVIELDRVIRGAGDTSMDEFVGLPEK